MRILRTEKQRENEVRTVTPYDLGILVFGVIALAGVLVLLLDKGLKSKGRP